MSAIGLIRNVSSGVAQVITNQPIVQAVTPVINALSARSDADGGIESFFDTFSLGKTTGGPPYSNILEEFASYTPLWTLACLEPNQFNDPTTYRGIKGSLRHVIFSSAGRFGSERVNTAGGQPEYFVNNFNLTLNTAANEISGNSNVTKLEFEVYEPYSMGLFIESLAVAAVNAGYPTYNDAPFVLMLEFYGHKDNGAMFSNTDLLTKYFPIRITDVKFTTNEGGSTYKCSAAPYNHLGFSNMVQQITNDLTLRGNTVEEMLVSGQVSICGTLNALQKKFVAEKKQLMADEYIIVFPTGWDDKVGLPTSDGIPLDAPVVNLPFSEGETANKGPRQGQYTGSYGNGPIGASPLGFGPTSGGNYNFGFESDVVDPATGLINRENLKIDPSQRTFTFPKGTTIQAAISQVVLSSKYSKDAIDPSKMDDKGMISWFRIDVQVEIGGYDPLRNERQKRYVFRVLPFYVHNSVFRNPRAAPPGYTKINKIIAKEYNYIYTGQNNDLLKFDITINTLYTIGRNKNSPEQSASVANPDIHQSGEDPDKKVETEDGGSDESAGVVGATSSKADPDAAEVNVKGGYGAMDVEQKIAAMFQKAILSQGSSGDLVNIKIEILGDPYWLADTGMGNYVGDVYIDPKNQQTADGVMNFQGIDAYIRIIFRTPIEPELEKQSEFGLYKFPSGTTINPYSGIYKVRGVVCKFSDGVFKQELDCIRMPNQPQDYQGYRETPPDKAFNTNIKNSDTPRTAPTDDGLGGGFSLLASIANTFGV
jgi:hypothetical protein